ncbi:hypothetical protein HanHA300_Chr11g0388291 [Helianthus annuus]|nr:hypothetical protein HanHA300_Chr11g0388291 [Helianthus annuus]KAJ0516156.1 hypothetical protein HanHA89_Chr11g0410661 [Helianthus annuus]KAJ0684182.1 hypothetical protein HanLR1_Chr11g0388351 [Helianthus annuus]
MLADKVDPDEATFANLLRAFSGDRVGHYSLKEIHQLCSFGVTADLISGAAYLVNNLMFSAPNLGRNSNILLEMLDCPSVHFNMYDFS